MASLKMTVYIDKDNTNEFLIIEDQILKQDLSDLTQVQLRMGDIVIDSDTVVVPDDIWWTDQKIITQALADADKSGVLQNYVGQASDVLKFQIGHSDQLVADQYPKSCIILFDATSNVNGSVWDDDVTVLVKGC